jgi:anti-anti-sigma factor
VDDLRHPDLTGRQTVVVPGARFDVVEHEPSRCHVVVAGEIDVATAPALRGFLRTRLREVSEGAEVVVDLARVHLLAAAGLRVLLVAAAVARSRQVAIRLHPLSPAVSAILDLTDTRDEFDFDVR